MSVNQVILMGNLGNDPEVKQFENGGVIANVSIAKLFMGGVVPA